MIETLTIRTYNFIKVKILERIAELLLINLFGGKEFIKNWKVSHIIHLHYFITVSIAIVYSHSIIMTLTNFQSWILLWLIKCSNQIYVTCPNFPLKSLGDEIHQNILNWISSI